MWPQNSLKECPQVIHSKAVDNSQRLAIIKMRNGGAETPLQKKKNNYEFLMKIMEKLIYITLICSVRDELEITNSEYILADTIYHLSNNPNNKIPGWCYASRQTLAKTVGITERAIRKMIANLESKNLIEKDETTKHLRTTEKWYQKAVLERNNSENRQDGTKFRPPEQSSAETGTKFRPDAEQSSANNNSNNKSNNHIIDRLTQFEQFWIAYPRKVAKQKAKEIFKRIDLNENTFNQIMAKLEEYKQSNQWQKDGGQFIPHPTTWLNQGRWEDEILKTGAQGEDPIIPGYAKGKWS